MKGLRAFLVAVALIVPGAVASPMDADIEERSEGLDGRDTCVSQTVEYASMWDTSAEDFTPETGSSKRDTEDETPWDDVSESSMNYLEDRSLEERDYFWTFYCGEPGLQPNQGGIYAWYNQSAVDAARRRGFAYLTNTQGITSTTDVLYPHWFSNYEGIQQIYQNCPNGPPWFEFPILPSGNMFANFYSRPGLDRVVFSPCGQFCAVITHRGEQGNRFHACQQYWTDSWPPSTG